MRRISWHIQLIAVLAALCLAGQVAVVNLAFGAAAPAESSAQKAAINKELQEAIAKGELNQSGSAQGAAGAASGGGGLGSSEAFSNLTQKTEAEEEPVAQTTAATSTASSGLSTSVLVPVFVIGAALLVGIAFFIVRDARNVAPAGDGFGAGNTAGDRAARMRKRRAKAKAARRQRKRNR